MVSLPDPLLGLPQSVWDLQDFEDGADLCIAALRQALPGVDFQHTIEAYEHMPFAICRRGESWGIGGADHRFTDNFILNVWSYTQDPDGDEAGARLAEAIRVGLRQAAKNQFGNRDMGWIKGFDVIRFPSRQADWAQATGPVQFADLPDGAWRYSAQYAMSLRFIPKNL